uniref:Uncharacterized protein n=1 Tax=Arcella intermedia TaxID=1963864 RepID=A0A6B2KWP4_9EUKA
MMAHNPGGSIVSVFAKTLRSQFLLSFFLFVLYAIFSFAPSVILPQMVTYIQDYSIPYWHGLVYTAVVVICTILASMCYYHSQWQSALLGMKIRTMMMAAVYRKSTKIPKVAGESSGHIVNLFAADTQIIFDAMPQIISGFVSPIQIIGAIIYLGFYVNYYSLIVLAVIAVAFPFNIFLSFKAAMIRHSIQSKADVRLKLTTEFIQGIRIVKYYAWEKPFMKNITKARESELEWIKSMSLLRANIIFLVSSTTTIALALILLFYGIFGGELKIGDAFTVIAIMNNIRLPLTWSSVAFLLYAYNKASIDRVGDFLKKPERVPYVKDDNTLPVGSLSIDNVDFGWSSDSTVLKNVKLEVQPGEKVYIVGKVGSGKSSMVMSILGEMPSTSGFVNVSGNIAYVPQQAWIYNATVRDNILFGNKYDEEKYERVVKVSSLVKDFQQFSAGDLTEVGERGVNLSGGQKQRIAIARALYSDRDIVIFDDPLSAVDSHVSRYLFDNVIKDYLKDKTLIMVTNQLQYLPYADRVVFISDGGIAGQGTFKELNETNTKFSKLIKKYGILEETEENLEDKVETKNNKNEEKKHTEEEDKARKEKGTLTMVEEKQSGLIPMKIYWYLLKCGGLRWFYLVLFLFTLYGSCRVLGIWWLNNWTSSGRDYLIASYMKHYVNTTVVPEYSTVYWSLTYVAWLLAESVAFYLALVAFFVGFTIAASKNLHNQLLERITYGTTTFFDITPLGRILSRLSQDMTTIDFMLPVSLNAFLNMGFMLLATLGGIGLGVWYIFLALLPLVVAYFGLQLFFRKSNIEVQRLESLSRSPPISHLSSTLNGMDTIRSFSALEEFIKLNDQHLDHNNVEKFALKFILSWYGIRLDIIGACIILFVFGGISLVRIFGTLDAGSAAIAMSYTSGFTSLLSTFSVYVSDLEIRTNAVERFWEYKQIIQEPNNPDAIVPEGNWPNEGKLEFKNFSFRYANGPLVLKNLDLVVTPQSKTAIVGRTGAGKSSLLQALYRILEPADGTIMIDGVDYRNVKISHLRSKLAIIPQDPTLFMESLRYNLDPFEEYTDEQIWDALEMVQLREVVIGLPDKLMTKCEENGSNFSVGQRQLLCMARAILKKSSILLLDEATASVDVETDGIIQSTIRKAFKNCTVLTIAHRLNTIMDSDMILVLEKGEIAEYDSPVNLLNLQGLFYSMVQATGPSSAEYLMKIAKGEISVLQQMMEESSMQQTRKKKPKAKQTKSKTKSK